MARVASRRQLLRFLGETEGGLRFLIEWYEFSYVIMIKLN